MSETAVAPMAVAVFGAEDLVLGYRALGFQVHVCRDAAEFGAALEKSAAQTVVCLVQEDLYRDAAEKLRPYRERPLPVIIPFSRDGRMTILERMISEIKRRATGAT